VITILLVRHADIDLPPATADPPLNSAGRRRAEALAHVVRPAGVTTVFTSSLRRTEQTVQPLGIAAGEMPDPAVVAGRARTGEYGPVVLIAGHTNTVPAVITALGVPRPPVIPETQFDNLFVVTLTEPAGASLLALKYGRNS
jgi:phosphohistidine phosphatase SixA